MKIDSIPVSAASGRTATALQQYTAILEVRALKVLRGATLLVALLVTGNLSAQGTAKDKVFLDMSYSGNIWQGAAANGVKALAATPPYDKLIEFKTVISGTDVQRQISDLQSMIAAGAKAILLYPLSPTALNRVLKQASDKGVIVCTYDSTVTEPSVYNVSNITARYGANTAQWMVNKLNGKGEIIFNHGGTYGSLQAVLTNRPTRLVVIAGQSNNGYRLMMADSAMQAKGLQGISSSAGPAVGGYAFKVMMEIVEGKQKVTKHNIEYPLPWVEAKDIKVCTEDRFEGGCNVFPAEKVPPLFLDTSLDPNFLPELSLNAVQTGNPTPGATIQSLPPVKYADDLPGINCQDCNAPQDWLEPNLVTPIPVPN